MPRPITVGAVMYDPKVSVIWEIIRDFFEGRGCPIDVTFFSTYGLLVTALIDGHVEIAWNSPLAFLDAQRRTDGRCRAVAMRDTDRDRMSFVVAKRTGPVGSIHDLQGRTLAVGSVDSPQATLIPLGLLRQAGLAPGHDVNIKRFDVLVGKHGDHVGGELEALRCLQHGEASACAMLDLNWNAWTGDGTIDPGGFAVVAPTDMFDHCVFTVRSDFAEGDERRWLGALFSMRYDDPKHREMMDLEGLKAWMPGRTTGFAALARAVEAEQFFERQP